MSGGYTIVEVIIFLVISTALLFSAMGLISGKQSQVQFNQSMRNIQTKMESWIGDVSNGFTGGDPNQLSCTLDGGRPYIKNGGPNPSSSPDCIFIGKAVQFNTNASTLYTYSVFGSRLDNANQPVSNMVDANPRAATAQNNSGTVDLTEQFSTAPAQIKSVTSKPVSSSGPNYTSSHMIGFFLSFNTEQTTIENGSENVNVYQYQFSGSDPTPADQPGSTSGPCLELLGNCKIPDYLASTPNQWPEKLQSLQVCFTDGRQTALLTISSVDGLGASVKLDYKAC